MMGKILMADFSHFLQYSSYRECRLGGDIFASEVTDVLPCHAFLISEGNIPKKALNDLVK